MPKAPSFSEEDEEKTTIESGWGEEASTTVEQGDVAEKIRALGMADLARPRNNITNVTSTGASSLAEEHTVDDGRANAVLSTITVPVVARLMITQGNDAGQELEIVPGKSYTIGRGIDNDLVLSDIAVSRKHFDLRYEGGAWVLADRGSGNGTIVNGAIEDQPFMLATGDLIEIGNTTFRYEQQNGAPRGVASFDQDQDEEEPSTVAGKPIRSEESPAKMPLPAMTRAKTVPPPAPLPRPRAPTNAPLHSYPPVGQHSLPPIGSLPLHMQPQPASTLPLPQLGSRNPNLPPAPVMLGDGGRPHMHSSRDGRLPTHGGIPSTIAGQGMPLAATPQPVAQFGYPNLTDMPHQHAQMRGAGNPGRDPTSTALVQPAPYGMAPMMVPAYVAPQLSRRTKLLLGGAALSLFAAIATIAIIKGSSSSPSTNAATKPTVETIEPATTAAPIVAPIKPEGPKTEAPKTEAPKTEPMKTAKVEPAKVEAPTIERAKVEPAKVEPAKVAAPKTETPKPEPAKVAKVEPRKVAPKTEPAKVVKDDPERTTKRTTKPERAPERTPERAPRVATADVSASDAKDKAEELYRAKKFSEAAAVLRKAGSSIGGNEGSDLKSTAGSYEQFGRAYNVGMAPATKPLEAYGSLQKAKNLDVGRVYADEIKTKLAQVAPRAAISLVATKDYEAAFQTLRVAESAGGSNQDTKLVRNLLEQAAAELYSAAAKEADRDPDAAKAKIRQIRGMVDAKNSWHQKATKLLATLG